MNIGHTIASASDQNVLRALGQEQSMILNSKGDINIFTQTDVSVSMPQRWVSAMPTLVRQQQDTVLKNHLLEWWHVGPLQMSMDISNNPIFRHFDEEECHIGYFNYQETKKEYTSEDDNYAGITPVCERLNIPYVIADNGAGQMLFYIPSRCKMDFLNGLEAFMAEKGEAGIAWRPATPQH
jgi:hypothetical protein